LDRVWLTTNHCGQQRSISIIFHHYVRICVVRQGTPIYPGVPEGCHAFTDASMSDPTRPQIEVCGDVKVTAYLMEDCRSYHSFQKQLGCSAGCTTLSPAADAWISRAGSYKIEKCEGEL